MAPMFVLQDTGEHVYVGDIIKIKDANDVIAKITKFFTIEVAKP